MVLALRGGARAEYFLPPPAEPVVEGLVAAHRAARTVLADVPGLRTGWTVANLVMEATDPAYEERAQRDCGGRTRTGSSPRAPGDDVVGVQSYTRTLVGEPAILPPPAGAPTTQTGWEFYPPALGRAVRHAAAVTGGTPCLVTENGVATADDDERIRYTHGRAAPDCSTPSATASTSAATCTGACWTTSSGPRASGPRSGWSAVDPDTFARTPKPSAHWLGRCARDRPAGRAMKLTHLGHACLLVETGPPGC